MPGGGHIRPDHYERWTRRALIEIPCSTGEYIIWLDWLYGQLGKAYDQQAILGFILGISSHGEGRWICSACQTGALKAAGLLHGVPIPNSQIPPDALYLLATAALGGKVMRESRGGKACPT